MRRLLPLLSRNIPLIAKKIILPTICTYTILYTHPFSTLQCATDSEVLSQTISSIEQNVIKILHNGNLVGDAFCFAENYLISVGYKSPEDKQANSRNYEFYLGDKKLQGNFKMIGYFQNITFFQHTSKTKISPLPADTSNQKFQISPVQILRKGQYVRIKNGYLVSKDSGYGIVDGKGEIGSLVIKNGKAAGIVTQIGRDLQQGFLRIIQWKSLPKILNYLKMNKSIHLGISAQAIQFKQGISVVRIAPNSPFKDQLMMGDTILKANNQKIRQVEALQRICILSEGSMTLDILRDQIPMKIKVHVQL